MSLAVRFSVVRMFGRMVGRVPAGHLWLLLRRMRNERPHRFAGTTRINTFFPPYPSRAFDRFCEAVVRRRRVPFSTYLAVTGRCPYRCPHCSYAGRRDGEMTTRQMLDVIAQVKDLGTCTLGLTGGEPMLRDDLPELIAAAGPQMASILFTSGHRLDAARAGALAAAKLTCVTIGIESADRDRHDEVRGVGGSFEEARAAAAACRDAGLYLAVSTVATRQRIASGELQQMYDLAAEWGAREFRILAPVATGGWLGCGRQMLSPEETRTLVDFHVRHNRRRGLLRAQPRAPAVACFAYLESADLFGCGAGYHHLFIDATGEVCPCDLTPLSFGNVLREPLAGIWQRMGKWFGRPRCRCLMERLAGRIPAGTPLPVPPEQSQRLVGLCPPDEPLPEGYRRLL